jgi:hypothetical protein
MFRDLSYKLISQEMRGILKFIYSPKNDCTTALSHVELNLEIASQVLGKRRQMKSIKTQEPE